MDRYLAHLLFGSLLFIQIAVHAQQHPVLKQLDSLVEVDSFKAVQDIIADQEALAKKIKTGLNLGKLVYPMAKTEFLLDNRTSFPKSEQLLETYGATGQPDSVRYEAFLGMGLAHVDQGTVDEAQKYIVFASSIAHAMQDIGKMVASEYHLGEIGLKLGDIGQLMERTDNALRLMENYPKGNYPLAPRIFNYKGSLMHFTAKPDSANYYFEKALQRIDPTDSNPEYRYYLPGTIYGNWTMVKQSAGDYDTAMKLTLKSISSFNNFLQRTNNNPLTEKVHGNLSIAYRNLGSLYNDLGDKEKAIQVATMGYHHAKKYFLPNTVQYFSAILMMGEAHLYGERLGKARTFLDEAEASLNSIPGDNWSYAANLYHAMADLEKKAGNLSAAITNYQKTLKAYSASSPEEFSQNIIYARSNLALTYAENKQFDRSEDLLEQTYSKVAATFGSESYLAHMIQRTQLKVSYLKGDFKKTIQLCERLLEVYGNEGKLENRPYLWSEQNEILLFLARSKLELLPHSVQTLEDIAKLVDEATSLVEKRKSLITTPEGVSNLIADNEETFNLAKKVYLELYDKTKNKDFLDKVVALHESSIYNRIRARLNLAGNILVPDDIKEEESNLRDEINNFFEVAENGTRFDVAQWDSLNQSWKNHLQSLQKKHPEYYRMRYAAIVAPLKNLREHTPHNTTLVRYFSDEANLYAYVYQRDRSKLLKLGRTKDLCISVISDYNTVGEELYECLYELYQKLWKPLESLVSTENVIIFPDGELFNLAFELLTPQRVHSDSELATGSLLAKYNISYNYSLFMLDNNQKVVGYREDFVAFVPEFDEKMKEDYQMAVSDSLYLDKTYLTLLPQPFSTELVKKFSRKFDGSSFLNERASKPLFTKHAREHKIIHIGTHAESNNVSPELSRLVFAKNVSDSVDVNDNYLYTYEIYNQNLSSNLTILTACETGRPTYQPGEGMISLAHAFNYAGSESVLTSLWQIDEKSSNQILESFYGHLLSGKAKDEALRLAKLDYLAHAEGRALHPQYWAGLILMGDTSPVELSQTKLWPLWGFVALILVLWVVVVVLKKKSSHKGSRSKTN
ncbi:CHAT domain-containing tetratricopeptide repeat protein [Flagellimonas crocea]|uniref:CHAT domain-containing tetratricopeptide repeat protein n=1 Tax=Flagellimonas crocea TaxID=3067311 RepID=UPI00296E697B|nr:CHAT domain-containing tetratricopeptide repeat protein [Muricauda sp. DH64]